MLRPAALLPLALSLCLLAACSGGEAPPEPPPPEVGVVEARAANLPPLRARLATLPVRDVRVIPMGQGQKQSRLLAWTFLDKKQRRAWRRARWPAC